MGTRFPLIDEIVFEQVVFSVYHYVYLFQEKFGPFKSVLSMTKTSTRFGVLEEVLFTF